MFEDSSHQVEAPGDQDVDLGRVAQRSRFGPDAGFHGEVPLGRAGQHRVSALGDPLEGAEDAGEDQGVGLPFRDRVQAFDEQLRTFVEMPAPLVVQAARQHVLHRDVEVLLV